MKSAHIPNVLCYRILFFHLCWTPRVQSKQSGMVQLSSFPSPLSYFQHYLRLSTLVFAKRSMALWHLSGYTHFFHKLRGEGNLKPSCAVDQTDCRVWCRSKWVLVWVWAESLGLQRSLNLICPPLILNSLSFSPFVNKIQPQWFRAVLSTEAGLSKGHLPTCQDTGSGLHAVLMHQNLERKTQMSNRSSWGLNLLRNHLKIWLECKPDCRYYGENF